MGLIDIVNEGGQKNGFDYKKHIIGRDKINSRLDDYLNGNIKRGYGIGFDILDGNILAKKNELFACVGKKGRGKTTIEEILFLMWSIANGVKWALCLQENDESLEKMNLLGYLFGCNPKLIQKENKELYNNAVEWIDEHFYFLDVETFKEALDVTEQMIKNGIDINGLFLDPVNSFDNGFVDTGNSFQDERTASKKNS